jgi:hypothetical protein
MSPEEQCVYANDFESRFLNKIAGVAQGSTDPTWWRLHRVVEQCAR